MLMVSAGQFRQLNYVVVRKLHSQVDRKRSLLNDDARQLHEGVGGSRSPCERTTNNQTLLYRKLSPAKITPPLVEM